MTKATKTSTDPSDHFPFKTIMAFAAVGLLVILWSDGKVQELADACAKRGGVMLRDYTCIKAGALVPPRKGGAA